jgi:hypothetical protein
VGGLQRAGTSLFWRQLRRPRWAARKSAEPAERNRCRVFLSLTSIFAEFDGALNCRRRELVHVAGFSPWVKVCDF